ncbi:MAG: hypothetical protein RL354_1494, partial [Planctomycetota bacterium]
MLQFARLSSVLAALALSASAFAADAIKIVSSLPRTG